MISTHDAENAGLGDPIVTFLLAMARECLRALVPILKTPSG